MGNIARSYTVAEVGKMLLASEGRPRPSKAYANPSASDSGHALSLHAIGGLGRKQQGINLDGLLQRSIASASAYAHGDIVLATQAVLNSGAGQAALRNMQQLGVHCKYAEISYCFAQQVRAQQVENMRMPSGRLAKGWVYGSAEIGTLVIEPNDGEIFVVTSYPDTRQAQAAALHLIPGRGTFNITHYMAQGHGVGHIEGIVDD
jgi:hypothetical protein